MAALPNMIADESARFLGVAVDKIQAFCSVFVYFGVARGLFQNRQNSAFHSIFVYFGASFGGYGRQISGFSLDFCLLRLFLEDTVDKFRAFAPFLSTSMVARGLFEGSGRQNPGISLHFCLLRGRVSQFWRMQ